MAKVITDNQHYKDIADAIRAKTESGDSYKPSEMADAIMAIEGGGEFDGELEPGFVTPTGQEFTAYPDGAGFSSVTVAGDVNLEPQNIAMGVTIYGVEGTLKIGSSTGDVPAAYQPYLEEALNYYGGEYEDLMILESTNMIGFGFMQSGFAIESYNSGSSEFTASGWVYVRCNKTTGAWVMQDWSYVTSEGQNYVNHIRYCSSVLTYNGTQIYPVGGSGIDGNTVTFIDRNGSTVAVFSALPDVGIHAPVCSVDEWETSDGSAVEFPYTPTSDVALYQPKIKYDPVFANNSWEDIIAACQNNAVPSSWSVGDSKTMVIGGYDYQIDIIGKNHDVYSDGSGTAPITFQTNAVYFGTSKMNNTAINEGGWGACTMRSTTLPSAIAEMPEVVQAALKQVNKKYRTSEATGEIATVADKLFLLSESEVVDTPAYSVEDEGERYAYYANGGSTTKVNRKNDAKSWWTRSIVSTWGFVCINASGSAYFESANNDYNMGASFAFCF